MYVCPYIHVSTSLLGSKQRPGPRSGPEARARMPGPEEARATRAGPGGQGQEAKARKPGPGGQGQVAKARQPRPGSQGQAAKARQPRPRG